MMNTAQIKKKIKTASTEIDVLQSRLANVENDLSRLKDGIDLDDTKAKKEVQALKSDRDLIRELIQEKQKQLEALNDDLEKQSATEKREQTISQLIELAAKAHTLEESFHKEMQALDEVLKEKIPELVRIRSDWEKSAKAFMNLADQSGLGKGLKAGSAYASSCNGRLHELNADNLLKELEEKGANLRPVTSGRILSSQHFTNITNPKPLDLTFGENLSRMLDQSNVRDLLQKVEA